MHTGIKSDTVGPGEYDINRHVGRKGPTWHPPKTKQKSALSTLANKAVA